MKTFYSLEDIESLVAQGVRELIVDEDAVLTDVARDAAVRLGLKLVPKVHGSAAPAQPLPAAATAPGAAARPRGCQHGPLGGHGQAGTAQSSKGEVPAESRSSYGAQLRGAGPGGPSGSLVDDLVGAVRQMAGKAQDR